MFRKIKMFFKNQFQMFEAGDLVSFNEPIYRSEEECGWEGYENNWKQGVLIGFFEDKYFYDAISDKYKKDVNQFVRVFDIEDSEYKTVFKKNFICI